MVYNGLYCQEWNTLNTGKIGSNILSNSIDSIGYCFDLKRGNVDSVNRLFLVELTQY